MKVNILNRTGFWVMTTIVLFALLVIVVVNPTVIDGFRNSAADILAGASNTINGLAQRVAVTR